MDDFEFLRHVTIGQYFQGESIVHRVDPRIKLTVMLILVILNAFIVSVTGNLIVVLLCAGLVLLSGISFRFILSGIRPALPIIILFALMQLFFQGKIFQPYGIENIVYWEWGFLAVTSGSIQLVIVTILRFLEIFFLVSLLTSTTTTTDLAYAIEDMLRPFQRVGVPAYEISLIGTIALRFVPIFAEELEMIMKAQASRGADFGRGRAVKFIKRTRQLVSLIVPLFVDAFRRAEDLVLAMEARCYTGGRGRTQIQRFSIQARDFAALGVTLVVFVFMMIFRNSFPM